VVVVLPESEMTLGEVAGNCDPRGSDDADDVGNRKCNHSLEKHTSGTEKINQRYY